MYRRNGWCDARGETSKDLPARFFLHPPGGLLGPPRRLPAATAHYVYCIPVESVLLLLLYEREGNATPDFSTDPGYNYIFASHTLDKQTLSWSKTLLGERFLADWCGPSRALSSRASPLCGTGRTVLKFGASHLALGLILAPIRTFALSGRWRCESGR